MREPPEEVAIRMVVNMRGSEIGRRGIKPGCGWAITMPSKTVAHGTVLLERMLALRYGLGGSRSRVGEIGSRIGVYEDDA